MHLLFSALYSLGIGIYYLGIFVSSWWNEKAKRWLRGRKYLFTEIESSLQPDEYRVWFHCASAGEFEQGRPVIEAYRSKFPDHKIILTFFSPSGFELRKNYHGADYIFYLPLDTRRNASRFISLVNPRVVIFVKYEFWFHFLSELIRRNIPAVMISAVFRQNHFLFNSLASPLKKVMMGFRKIFVQDETSLQLLNQNEFTNTERAGDTRVDRVWEIASSPKKLPLIAAFKGDNKLFVAGSTWPEDEKLILQLASELPREWSIVIVPHEISSSHLKSIRSSAKLPVTFYSEMETGKINSGIRILVVDRFGLLSSLYQYADIAYVGGGFGKGIHNTLEAAVFGIPVLFGPNYEKFSEAKALIKSGGGKSVKNFSELKEAFQFYQQPQNIPFGKSNRDWVKQNTGATEIIMKFLEQLNSDSAASRA